MRAFAVLLTATLAACASSSGVVSTGPGTYMVANKHLAPGASGGPLLADLYREAGEFCAKQGGQVQGLQTGATDHQPFGQLANARLEFRCVK
jgi:hypothetical protein